MIRYAYFPGCSAKGSCSELDYSIKKVAAALGVELLELQDAGCTGAREIRAADPEMHLAINARILSLAERQGLDLMVVCDTCLLNLVEVNHTLKRDPAVLKRVNGYLEKVGHTYRATVTVKHYLWVLLEDVGLERIRSKVVRPLSGLRVAPFYGCHILRPQSVFGLTRSDEAASIETLANALGCEPVDYDGKDQCCGFHVAVASEDVSLRLSGRHVVQAKEKRADVMVTPCPLCHTILDAFQPNIEKKLRTRLGVPILHLSQLVGLAIGMSPDELKLPQHVVRVRLPLQDARFRA